MLGSEQAPAEILGLQDEDAVGEPHQMVDLGPARAVGPRQEDVVHRLDPVPPQQTADLPLAEQAEQPRTLRVPRRGGQAEPAGEQQRLRIGETGQG